MQARHRWTRPLALTALALLIPLTASCSDDGSEGSDAPERRTTTTATDDDGSGTTVAGPTTTTAEPVPAEEPDAYVQALVATYGEDAAAVIDLEQAACIAEAWVETLGPEAFASAGVRSSEIAAEVKSLRDVDIDEATGKELGATMTACGVDLRPIVYGSLGEAAADPAVRACLDDAVSDELVQSIVVSQFTAIPAPDDAFESAVVCLPG